MIKYIKYCLKEIIIMPSILTHYYFIKDSNKEKFTFLENEEKVMYLGAQGVDPFYYYGNIFKRPCRSGKGKRKNL